MRDVVLYTLLSLDGVAEEPSNWLFDPDPAIVENLTRIIATQDAILLGRRTYDDWVETWPESDFQPFANFVNQTRKYVFTGGTPDRDWANTTVVSQPATEYVAQLKGTAGGEIGIHGSVALAQSMLAADLVDELRLLVVPTTAGRGARLFATDVPIRRWQLIGSQSSATGLLLLTYRTRS